MTTSRTATALGLTAAVVGAGSATPAAAGGVGDFVSPAFGTSCANHHASRAVGATTAGSGSATGNLAGLPVGGPLNQCGGADAPDEGEIIEVGGDILEKDITEQILKSAASRRQGG